MKELSISQVAKRTGVSARMLRHYDEIGLFVPSRVSHNGYRWYATESLPRLYRIVALRRAGLGLPAIASVVADQESEVEALRGHSVDLKAERHRLSLLINAIDEQITQLDEVGTVALTARERHAEESAAFALRLKGEFGAGAGEELRLNSLEGLSDADVTHIAAEMQQLMVSFAGLMTAGHDPDSVQAHELVGQHFALTTRYWPTDVRTYRSLGRLYEIDPLQRGIATSVHQDLPSWLARAIESYADGLETSTAETAS